VSPLRVGFAGTPEFAVPTLQALLDLVKRGTIVIAGVWTQPDRPQGRGLKLTPSPVKQLALAHALSVHQPEKLKTAEQQAELAAAELDLLVVVAYGLLLPQAVLDLPRFGCWNVHASLLPRWRGAAPIQRAIEAGDVETGCCLMQMDIGLDTGPVITSSRVAIGSHTSQSLFTLLSQDGAALLQNQVAALATTRVAPAVTVQVIEPSGETEKQPSQPLGETGKQPSDGVTYAKKIDKAEAVLDFTRSARALERQVRAFTPWPGSTATVLGQTFKVLKCELRPIASAAPGSVLSTTEPGILLATSEGGLLITELQIPGGKPIAASDFKRNHPAFA
jgi:methionyl-tRNA formyltransferase